MKQQMPIDPSEQREIEQQIEHWFKLWEMILSLPEAPAENQRAVPEQSAEVSKEDVHLDE
ncbi:hypothetical protein [Anthocerotibacter panamensis]|uniref:hypothetical protein n=1 Tax=Anthocerotibacter panamensis TaxID=2857077 RepID=UPI001C403883|nr:hypothetical protein [Anthocerotibacter panamensis]